MAPSLLPSRGVRAAATVLGGHEPTGDRAAIATARRAAGAGRLVNRRARIGPRLRRGDILAGDGAAEGAARPFSL